VSDAVRYLLSSRAVRERAGLLFALCREGKLRHFAFDEAGLGRAADLVATTIRDDYPDLRIPYHSRWRHFEMGGVDRWGAFAPRLPADPAERGRARVELAIASVLLDAGAGPDWRYEERATGQVWRRSEGLAAASFAWVTSGAFSTAEEEPWRVEASRLAAVTDAQLAAAFQVGDGNPLVGLAGRVALLRRLGDAVATQPRFFGTGARLGNLFDHLAGHAEEGRLPAARILETILAALGPIWPGRIRFHGAELGDAWRHPALPADDGLEGIAPFHKLSQWLTYSLLEPLEEAGIVVTGLDELTGLPEYRNGGLLLDCSALVPRHDGIVPGPHEVSSDVVVEWRALTVALLDRVAEAVRGRLALSAAELPLAKVLQGGTWSAGRRIAREKRPDGTPPIAIDSDGTVF
jgi:hypothetical protein